MLYRFDDCELDTDLFELRREGQPVRIEPQVFEVLAFLITHHDRIVTKNELFDEVWGNRFVSDAALNSRLMAARRAIGDGGREQRLIRTVHGRGYRFIGTLEVENAPAMPSSPEPAAPVSPLPSLEVSSSVVVGREDELRQLDVLLSRARQGQRQLVFLAGEAGIGKTTILDEFTRLARQAGAMLVARGHCFEQRSGGDAYAPVFDALEQCAKGPDAGPIRSLILGQAPSWAAQMPGLFAPEEQIQAQQRSTGTTGERMLREFIALCEGIAASSPLLLLLEDLHWADFATVDLLSAVARRRDPARIMTVVTYRPADARMRSHPLDELVEELSSRGMATRVDVPPLSLASVEGLLQHHMGGSYPENLPDALHQRTEGNAFFLTSLLSELPAEALSNVQTAGDLQLPRSVRSLIEQQIDSLNSSDRELVEAASVAGQFFSTVELAAALSRSPEATEEACDALANHGSIILRLPEMSPDWPDGSFGAWFTFVHSLQREVLYSRLSPTPKARVHQQIGLRLEQAYGAQATRHASELATHFVEGRNADRAIHYLEVAASQATSRGAYRDAEVHLTSALALLTNRPDVAERPTREMRLRTALGASLLVTRGFGHAAVLEEFTAALKLAEEAGDTESLGDLIVNLAALHEYRAQHSQAESILLEFTPQASEPSLQVPLHALLSCSYFHQGEFGKSQEQGNRGLSLGDATRADPRFASLGEDPMNGCSEWSAEALWFLGYPDQALDRINQAVELAQQPDRQFSLASTQSHAARIHQLRREPQKALHHAAATEILAAEHGYAYHHSVAVVLSGWATAALGHAGGIEQILLGIEAHTGTGADMDRPYFLALLAEAYLYGHQPEKAFAAIESALAAIDTNGRFFYEAELHRLRAAVLAEMGADIPGEVEPTLRRALDLAREQEAKSLELRIVTSLAKALPTTDRATEAVPLLTSVYTWFSEGFETQDLLDARLLLTEMGQN